MAQEGLICWNCGKPTGVEGTVMRSDACEACLADLRSCRGCRHFDPMRRFHCRESIDHGVVNKEKSNFCDYFQMRLARKIAGGQSDGKSDRDILKKKLNDLFED